MYTPAQVSKMLEVPPSTLRRWAVIFARKLSDQQGRNHRLYTENDVVILQRIKQLINQNIPIAKIADRLEVIDEPTQDERRETLSLVPGIAAEIEAAQAAAASALGQLATLETSMLERSKEIEQLAAQVAQINNYLSIPWWKRLFIRPPR